MPYCPAPGTPLSSHEAGLQGRALLFTCKFKLRMGEVLFSMPPDPHFFICIGVNPNGNCEGEGYGTSAGPTGLCERWCWARHYGVKGQAYGKGR